MPGERCALHPHREFPDARKDRELTEVSTALRRIGVRRHHFAEAFEQVFGLSDFLALDLPFQTEGDQINESGPLVHKNDPLFYNFKAGKVKKNERCYETLHLFPLFFFVSGQDWLELQGP